MGGGGWGQESSKKPKRRRRLKKKSVTHALQRQVSKAGAAARGVPLYKHFADMCGVKKFVMPVPWMNVINGGSHAGNRLAMQVLFPSLLDPLGRDLTRGKHAKMCVCLQMFSIRTTL